MTCNLRHEDGPMTVAQMFAYLRHRYGDMRAYYLGGPDVIAIPMILEEDVVMAIRELAARKGLACSEVCAAWPELAGPGLVGLDAAQKFLVITAIDGPCSLPPGR